MTLRPLTPLQLKPALLYRAAALFSKRFSLPISYRLSKANTSLGLGLNSIACLHHNFVQVEHAVDLWPGPSDLGFRV